MFTEKDVISTYTRKQAHQDGVLVDLNQFIPINESPFKCPISCTNSVWEIIDKAVNNPKHMNDYKGVIWDVMFMAAKMGRMIDEFTKVFVVKITGAGRKKKFEFKLQIHAGDEGEMVGTIMLPNED